MMQEPEEAKPKQKRVVAADEGARYTKQLMAEVTSLRLAKKPKWSADRLAQEMTKVGVPWTRSTVNNLESGRRKQIAVHEVLALAWVLDVANPVDLLAPSADRYTYVLPGRPQYTAVVRAWFEGKTGPMRTRKPWGPEATRAAAEEMAGNVAEALGFSGADEGTIGEIERMMRTIVERNRAAEPTEDDDGGQG